MTIEIAGNVFAPARCCSVLDGLAPALDAFSLDLSDGYSNSGNLVDGSITLQ